MRKPEHIPLLFCPDLIADQKKNNQRRIAVDVYKRQQLYNYGELGHFWVKGYENLRVMEYQIAILRDKYEYLGEKYCTEYEGKLAMLRDFPPLNYLFYPAVPEKYIAVSYTHLDELSGIGYHEILLEDTEFTSVIIAVIRIQEQCQVVKNVLFVKGNSIVNHGFICQINVK